MTAQNAEYVAIRRENVDALLKLIDDRWTSPETVLKRIRDAFWAARRGADYGLMAREADYFRQAVEDFDQRMAAVCENCGKPMIEHDGLAHCWPERADHTDGAVCAPRREGQTETHGNSLESSKIPAPITPQPSIFGSHSVTHED